MKIINLEQGSNEWLAWRKTVITATDCPAIRGSSPWTTPYQCWQKKLGLAEETKSNDAMERGKRLEPILRDNFIKRFGINMNPLVVESSEYSFLGASLDGISDCHKYLLEIKTGGEKLMAMAKRNEIPEYYMDQMQHQLLVTRAEKCFYLVGDEKEFVVIEVFPDAEFYRDYLPIARSFMRCVAFNEPPELKASDYKEISNPEWQLLAQEYLEACEELKKLEERKDTIRKQLLTLSEGQNCIGFGIKTLGVPTKGRIAYDDIPELKDVDKEKYRKPSTIVWKILVA